MVQPYKRFYTFTMKASLKSNKGSIELLKEMFNNFLNEVQGTCKYHEFEDKSSDNVHIHAMIHCPLIKDKKSLNKMFPGWSVHYDIVLYRDYDNIEEIWKKYILKSVGDSTRFEKLYGNVFLDFDVCH